MSVPALFLDRDGVINIDHAYVYRIDDFEFIPGIFSVCRHAIKLGYMIVVVTNQAGIGRGYYSEEDFLKLNQWMCARFLDEGITITKTYHCPFHPSHGVGMYKQDSYDRKPNPGMLIQAQQEFAINMEQSILIGDKVSDIQAGIAAGVGKNIYFSNVSDARLSSLNNVCHARTMAELVTMVT